jgi:hypothetical protein
MLKQALNGLIAPSTGLLKSWEFLYTLTIWTYIILHFHFAKKQYVSLALKKGHLRVKEISFYIQILWQFWNSVNEDIFEMGTTVWKLWQNYGSTVETTEDSIAGLDLDPAGWCHTLELLPEYLHGFYILFYIFNKYRTQK